MTEQTAQEPRPASEPAADGNAEPNGAVSIPGGTPPEPPGECTVSLTRAILASWM